MGYQQKKIFFFCYLLMSQIFLSMANEIAVTDELVNEITDEFMDNFDKDLDTYYERAPENPDNAIDEEASNRIFFLIPFLPKLAILLVKVIIKVAPLIIKAAVAVKVKVAAVAAAGLAKVSTVAALKATAITVGKKILIEAVTSTVIDVVVDKITDAVNSPPPKPDKKPSLVGMYEMNSEECNCWKQHLCTCCIKPKEFESGCFNITLGKTLWNEDADIRVGAFYGGKEIMTRKLKVGRPDRKCHMLSAPFNTTTMCVSTWGRTFRGQRVIQCFSVDFNRRGINKCIVQNKSNKLWFKKE